jgi:5-methylcytosine-specific restriction protein B
METMAKAGRPLSAQELFALLEQSGQLRDTQLGPTPDGKEVQYQRDVYFNLIAEVKAGWLKRPRNAWEVTPEGLAALQEYPDPSEFQREADRRYVQWRDEHSSGDGDGGRPSAVDRASQQDADAVLAYLYPDASIRRTCIERLGQSVVLAETLRPGSWSVTLFPQQITLNVGRIAVLTLRRDAINVTVSEPALDDEDRVALLALGSIQPFNASTIPEAMVLVTPPQQLDEATTYFGAAHEALLRIAVERAPRAFYARSHSPGVAALLRERLGIDIHDPVTRADTNRAPAVAYRTLDEALETWDRSAAQVHTYTSAAAAERERITALFPRAAWPALELDRYALGTDDPQGFCRVMEFSSPLLGSMRGGSSGKHIIYKGRADGHWHFPAEYSSVEEAWAAVRAGFVEAFENADRGDFAAADSIPALRPGAALRTKALELYFPGQLLPITSSTHLRHFIELLGGSPGQRDTVALNRHLIELVQGRDEFSGWSLDEVGVFLYKWADPRQTHTIVKIAPGEGAKYWPECRDNGYICVGWDETGDLSAYESREEFEEAFARIFREHYKGYKPTLTLKAREVWTLRELQPGDTVIANRGGGAVVGIGTVVEPGYVWRPERAEMHNTVSVRWDDTTERLLDPPVATWRTSTVATVSAELFQRITAGGTGPTAPSTSGQATPARPSVAPPPLFLAIETDLKRRGQVILHGPPGTGKTYTARRFSVWWLLHSDSDPVAEWILGDDQRLQRYEQEFSAVVGDTIPQLTRVTFHPSYSYEDFVEGFKPRPTEGRGGLELELRDGAFKAVCGAASANPESWYLLVIDEINRGNIPKIFGELITLLEKDKRGLSVRLPYSGESFAVPPNVCILGTMNTADRSIRLLDAALRRRFSFLELPPQPELLRGAVIGSLALDEFLLGLNDIIARRIGPEKQVGHSFFLEDGEPVTSLDDFHPRFAREVLPLLQEYAYGDAGLLEDFLGRDLVDVEHGGLRSDVVDDPTRLVDALARKFGAGSS